MCLFDCSPLVEECYITIFFSQYILRYEKIQGFSSDDLNSTLCYAALLLSCGQLTCTDLTSLCCTELCGTDVNGQTN